MQLISWNVNGIRACIKKDFFKWLKKEKPDVVCLQETKIHEDDIPDSLKNIEGYHSYWHSGKKKGYSGVAILSKEEPLAVQHGIGKSKFDDEGRVLIAEYAKFFLITCYFPNSGRGEHGRLDYKLDFNNHLLQYCNTLVKKGKNIVLCGDLNVAHEPIDLKNPKTNTNTAGYLPEERAWMTAFLKNGYVDTFRHFYPEKEAYTWWSYMFQARKRNIGWRIDYFCVNEKFMKKVKKTSILKEVQGSDHCPIKLEVE